jgi:hypothetical protein
LLELYKLSPTISMGRQSASKKKDTSKAWAAKGTKASAAASKSAKAGSTDSQKPRPKPKPAYKAAAAVGDAEKLASAALMMLGGDKRQGRKGARGGDNDDDEVEADVNEDDDEDDEEVVEEEDEMGGQLKEPEHTGQDARDTDDEADDGNSCENRSYPYNTVIYSPQPFSVDNTPSQSQTNP